MEWRPLFKILTPILILCWHLSEKSGRYATWWPSIPSLSVNRVTTFIHITDSNPYAMLESVWEVWEKCHLTSLCSLLFLPMVWRPLFTILIPILILCWHLSEKFGRSATWRSMIWRPLSTILTPILILCWHLSEKFGRSATWRSSVLLWICHKPASKYLSDPLILPQFGHFAAMHRMHEVWMLKITEI